MKVLIDAQLPKRLSDLLSEMNIDSRHTLELPKGNTSTDKEIIEVAENENRIVVTKDSDFLDNFVLSGIPSKLLIVSTGNINNSQLIELFEKNIDTLKKMFELYKVVEINGDEITVHY